MSIPFPEYLQIFIGVFALVSPPDVVPLFLGIISDRSVEDKKTVARIGAIGFFVTTSIFVFAGESILSVFGIEISAFQVAGGLLLLLIALDMMRSTPSDGDGTKDGHGSIIALGIVPLTIPILAGPGVLSAVVLFAAEYEGAIHNFLMVAIMAMVSVVVFLTLRVAVASNRFLRPMWR